MISCFCDLAASKRECADCSFVFALIHFPNMRKCAKNIGTLLNISTLLLTKKTYDERSWIPDVTLCGLFLISGSQVEVTGYS